MANHIRKDHGRFTDIVKKAVKKNVKDYISHHEMLVPRGKDTYAIPIPRIDLPKFIYGHKSVGGVGSGDGDIGTPISGSDRLGSSAGDSSEDHPIEVENSLEELSKMLCDELELPNLKDKGKGSIRSDSKRYNQISRVGPKSLAHFKRSYKEALKREISEGVYVPGKAPLIIHPDLRYRTPKTIWLPDKRALVIYEMDVSGSMGFEQILLVRNLAFWIDTYLRGQYPYIVNKYILHDSKAWETDRQGFYHTSGRGGTKLSSGIILADKMIEKEFSPLEWNIYLFHFSDGDNFGEDDDTVCLARLGNMKTYINQYAFAQVKNETPGRFKQTLDDQLSDDENIVTANLNERDDCYDVLKIFLGKGN